MGELRRGGRSSSSSSPKGFIDDVDAATPATMVAVVSVVVIGVGVDLDLAYDDAVGGRETY